MFFHLCSLLLRVASPHPETRGKSGEIIETDIELPLYSDRVYISDTTTPTAGERDIFLSLIDRESVTASQWRNQLDGLTHSSNVDMQGWIEAKLKREVLGVTPDLDLTSICKYARTVGFMYALDAAYNLEKAKISYAIVSACPSASFYTGLPPLENSIFLTKKMAWDSETCFLKSPSWDDGFNLMKNTFRANACLLIDVRAWMEGSFVPQGWGLLPVFTPDGFVQGGKFAVPLYHGAPPRTVLLDLCATETDVRCLLYLITPRK